MDTPTPALTEVPDEAFLPFAHRDTAPRYRLWGGLAAFFLVAGLFFETWVPPVFLTVPALLWLAMYHGKVSRHRRVRAAILRSGRACTATVVNKRVAPGMLYPVVKVRYDQDGRALLAEQAVTDKVGARCREGMTIEILVHPDHPHAWLPAALRAPPAIAQGTP
ncbi:MAG: hypothetical protein H0W72_05605 [Planctomycetes bacterium]|nr:hypothetical protein [Planctomycetota bacterium]